MSWKNYYRPKARITATIAKIAATIARIATTANCGMYISLIMISLHSSCSVKRCQCRGQPDDPCSLHPPLHQLLLCLTAATATSSSQVSGQDLLTDRQHMIHMRDERYRTREAVVYMCCLQTGNTSSTSQWTRRLILNWDHTLPIQLLHCCLIWAVTWISNRLRDQSLLSWCLFPHHPSLGNT